ncbi:ATP/GTP-binding protein [Succinimonas sp.]|uniref:AAA family ATPase n=1 Tax=Succinimonas sp. TaxID=1936151 RepID=UPI00386FC87D
MLKSFTVSNFKLFKNKVKIDFSATGDYSFNTEAITNGIVKTAIMYGKNASGKSSLGLAIFDIVANLTDHYVDRYQYINFHNLYSDNEIVSFEYVFSFSNADVIYSYTKNSDGRLISEKLSVGDMVFAEYNRIKSNKKVNLNFKGSENVVLNLERLNFSIIRFVKSNILLANDRINKIFEEFYAFVDKMLMFWCLENRGFIGYSPAPKQCIAEKIIKDGLFSDLQNFFKAAGFEDVLDHAIMNGQEQLLIKYGNNKTLDFNHAASSGMKSLLLVYFWLRDIADITKCPSFIFIDDFDAFYHFELSYFIIERLKSYNCQVLLTAHNTSVFTNDLLRPDCYYICSKDEIVNARNAAKQELRFGHNLEYFYKGGKFGK